MTRHVFFAFKWDPDVWRVNSIRNQTNLLGSTYTGYWDDSLNERSRARNEQYIKQKIRNALIGTSVTVVLVTYRTIESDLVKYEYKKSIDNKNKILQLNVSQMKDMDGNTSQFNGWLPYIDQGLTATWSPQCPLGKWIEETYYKG